MSRVSVLLALGLLAAGSGCGDSGGDGGGDQGPVDGGADQPDGSVGPAEPAEGQFLVAEIRFGADVYEWSNAYGSIVDPRPTYHRLEQESAACRLWTYGVASCGTCDGLCNADGDCVPWPVQLSAGVVTVDGPDQDLVMQFQDYGYYPASALPTDLFVDGDPVTLAAAGADVPAFSLTAAGVDPIAIELERGFEDGDRDALRVEDGADLVITWSPVAPGTRVRLDLLSNNRGHGQPVDSMIQCESDDTGQMVVPRAMIEAFPDKPYQNACAGSDCPPSSLTRFRSDRASAGGYEIELLVAAQRQFILVHEP